MTTGSRGSNRHFAGGKFVNDSIYQVKIGDLTFELATVLESKRYSKLRPAKVYEKTLDDAGYKYDPWSVDSTIFIHARRGRDTIGLSEIPDKSPSFQSFYEDFLGDWECQRFWYNDEPTDGQLDSIKAFGYTKDIFMDYDTALEFCPEGYHIPDTTEWSGSANYYLMNKEMKLRSDSPMGIYMTWGEESGYFERSIFWTSTAKDKDTQYCVQYGYNTLYGRYFECPRDLYPLVQAMCVRD